MHEPSCGTVMASAPLHSCSSAASRRWLSCRHTYPATWVSQEHAAGLQPPYLLRFWFPGGTEDAVTDSSGRTTSSPQQSTPERCSTLERIGFQGELSGGCGWGWVSLYLSVGLTHILENRIQQNGKPAEHVKG